MEIRFNMKLEYSICCNNNTMAFDLYQNFEDRSIRKKGEARR